MYVSYEYDVPQVGTAAAEPSTSDAGNGENRGYYSSTYMVGVFILPVARHTLELGDGYTACYCSPSSTPPCTANVLMVPPLCTL